MAFYSIGRNEILLLLEKEHQLKSKIKTEVDSPGVVSNFQTILMKKELEKIHTKLKILGYRSSDDGDVA
ncbi:MAG: hypothetical protein LBU35_01915 [Holosporales bacterium]|jgi:hypothetical protein|nr:hypothetical protein [Holosporales bacterium]